MSNYIALPAVENDNPIYSHGAAYYALAQILSVSGTAEIVSINFVDGKRANYLPNTDNPILHPDALFEAAKSNGFIQLTSVGGNYWINPKHVVRLTDISRTDLGQPFAATLTFVDGSSVPTIITDGELARLTENTTNIYLV